MPSRSRHPTMRNSTVTEIRLSPEAILPAKNVILNEFKLPAINYDYI